MRRGVLLLLAAANFAAGMGALGVVGLVGPVGLAFARPPAEAAWMMSLYALVYAVAAPGLVSLTGALDRARVLVAGLVLFGGGALAAGLAPGFVPLLIARAVMAVGGALITPVAASIGVALTPPALRGRALSLVFSGLTLAQALGVPACAWLGYAFGWRIAFFVVAGLALPLAGLVAGALPRGIAVPRVGLRTLGTALATPLLLLALSFTILFLGGAYAFHTFLGPYAEARHGLGRDGVTGLLFAAGLGAVLGNLLAGWLADRLGPVRTLALLGLSQALILLPLTLFHAPVPVLFLGVVLWSMVGWAFGVPQQLRLATLAPAMTPVLFALNAACIYAGASLGGVAGGAALARFGEPALGPTGAVLSLLAVLSLPVVARLGQAGMAKRANSPTITS